jgi:hypothetical protein
VVHPRHHGQLTSRDAGGGLPVGLDQRRIVGVTDQQRCQRRNLAQPTENRRILLLQIAG